MYDIWYMIYAGTVEGVDVEGTEVKVENWDALFVIRDDISLWR